MEEEYNYVITQRGEKTGPYTLRQLNHMRADNLLRQDAFEPEEWAALLEVLDQGKRTTRFLDGKRIIEIEPRRTRFRFQIVEFLFAGLTWVGYAVGAFFVVWGGLGMDEEMWKSPSLWLALIFGIAITRTAVNRAVMGFAIEAKAKASFIRLTAGFLLGLSPLALLLGVAWGTAMIRANGDRARLICFSVVCLVAAVLGSIRLPSGLRKWRYMAESPVKRFSLAWIALVPAVLAFMFLDGSADRFSKVKSATTYVKYAVFHLQSAEMETWRYPIHLGSSSREVDAAFGPASEIANKRRHYARQGVDVWYDFFDRVTKLSWTGLDSNTNNAAPIAWGITTSSTLKQLKENLGAPDTAIGGNGAWNHTWSRPPIYIAADGFTSIVKPDGVLKKLEISIWERSEAKP